MRERSIPNDTKRVKRKMEKKLSISTAYQLLQPHYIDFTNPAGSDPKIMEYATTEFCGLIAQVQAIKSSSPKRRKKHKHYISSSE